MTSRSVASTAVASTSPHLCLHGRHYFHAVVVSVSVATGTSPPNCGSASIYTGGNAATFISMHKSKIVPNQILAGY
ncbi:uncharacterized protein LOC120697565 isoform X4 [Panicum virgatum]|uniref:uncharacterized protein LOC120697565 isoform X4 n=1 Tax=Panicum virgatum TaxID=38727 RepID=UPI0019D52856|nr:uncharacterized protein LOC120697565 isoform X4 [Panicum virgatum]